MLACGGDRAGRGSVRTVTTGRGSRVKHGLGVGRGWERGREWGNRKGREAGGRAMERVRETRGSAMLCAGREGRGGREVWGMGRTDSIARVGGHHWGGLVIVRSEWEAVRGAYFPIEDTECVWDSVTRG